MDRLYCGPVFIPQGFAACISLRASFFPLLQTLLLAMLVQVAPRPALADGFPGDFVAKGLAEAARGKFVNIDSLSEGEMLSTVFVDRPIYIYRRTNADLARLEGKSSSELSDPTDQRFRESVRREFGSTSSTVWARLLLAAEPVTRLPMRSLDKRILVVAGWGPGSGCSLASISRSEREASGFLFKDPCTGTVFDAAGRAFSPSNRPGGAPLFNIAVPPYRLERQNVLLGPATGIALPALPFSPQELYGTGTSTQRLIGAARHNDIGAVREAIKSGADVRYYRQGEGSPLDAAIVGSSTEVVRLLLEQGARPTPNSEAAAQFVGRQDVLTLLRSVRR